MTLQSTLIRKLMPCEVCGNDDVSNFRLRVDVKKSPSVIYGLAKSTKEIVCLECGEKYPIDALDVLRASPKCKAVEA